MCRNRNKEVASDNDMRMISDESGPALILAAARGRGFAFDVFAHVDGESRICSFSSSSSAIRSSPHVGFSAARQIKRLNSAFTRGRPTDLDFQRQNRRNEARRQPIKVAGLTMINALCQSKKRASFENTNRFGAAVGAAFFSRSWNKAS